MFTSNVTVADQHPEILDATVIFLVYARCSLYLVGITYFHTQYFDSQ